MWVLAYYDSEAISSTYSNLVTAAQWVRMPLTVYDIAEAAIAALYEAWPVLPDDARQFWRISVAIAAVIWHKH
jgi:hypothetical protein